MSNSIFENSAKSIFALSLAVLALFLVVTTSSEAFKIAAAGDVACPQPRTLTT